MNNIQSLSRGGLEFPRSHFNPYVVVSASLYCFRNNTHRFTNPSASEAHLVSLQKEILREVLSYTPGHPSFGGGVGLDGSGKRLGNSSAGVNGSQSDEFTSDESDGLNAVKALANTGTTVMPTSAVPLPIPVQGSRNGAK